MSVRVDKPVQAACANGRSESIDENHFMRDAASLPGPLMMTPKLAASSTNRKAITMTHYWDEFSKSLAQPIARRESLRQMGAALTATVLALHDF